MTIAELHKKTIDELLTDFDTILGQLITPNQEKQTEILGWIKEYDMEHEILDRPNKEVGEGNKKKVVETAKLAIPFQKKIVNTAASFLFGEPVTILKTNEEEKFDKLYDNFMKAYKQAKLDYHNRRLARRLFIETQVAELFYIRDYNPEEEEEGEDDNSQANPKPKKKPKVKKGASQRKLKVMLLCKKNGDDIYPIWDQLGDLTAFIRKYSYESKESDSNDKVERVEIYTAKYNYVCTKTNEWKVERYNNIFKKIPVIYYEQEKPEWSDVQTLITRVEMMISKNADTNDYFGAPAIVSKGELKTAPDKDEVGKFFEIEPTISEGKATFGDLEYLTWDMAPEAIVKEYEMLKDLIYSQTSTPDLSFQNVKGTTNLSGIALKFMFFDSILKAKNKHEIFGEGLERRNNLIKVILSLADISGNAGIIDLELSVEFQEALPEDTSELIEMLTAATGGTAIMSRETAVKVNPFVEDPQAEIKALEAEDVKANAIPESYGAPQ